MKLNVKNRASMIAFILSVVGPLAAKSANVDGYAFLEGQSNHEGILITLSGSTTVPAIGVCGAGVLLAVLGWFLLVKRRHPGTCILAAAAVLTMQTLMLAALSQTTLTDTTGFYRFSDVSSGDYRISAQKECFVSAQIDPVHVLNSDVIVNDLSLSDLNTFNETVMPAYLKQIPAAQWQYNNNSAPHTYTGDLACLVSGNGAGGVGFLDPDFADGIVEGYQIVMEVDDPHTMPGDVIVYWHWYASAIPLSHGCSGRLSFFIDAQVGCPGCMIQAQDMGGGYGDETLPYVCNGDESSLAHLNMQSLVNAQQVYLNNSSPHTYTGDLACLVSGNGAGQVRFICPELGDGLACGYAYDLTASDPVGGVSDAWACTAWPVACGGDSIMTFFVDDSGVMRGGDIGGGPGDETLPDIGYAADVCP